MLPWLRELTGIELTDNVDATCSKYEYTGKVILKFHFLMCNLDTLLCHDDELEGRRVAFIYYLVDPTWSSTDGGILLINYKRNLLYFIRYTGFI